MKDFNFIDKQELTKAVFLKLYSYKNLGLMDESMIYPIIDNCLAVLGWKIKVFKYQVIKINDFKGELPEDFFKLLSIVKCDSYKFTHTNPSIQIDYEPVVCTARPCEEPLMNCDGTGFYLNQKFERFVFEANYVVPLKIEKVSNNKCFDYFEKTESVSIQNGYLNTEFREGVVYIHYESIENDGMIPDVPIIKEAIKNICIYELLYILYLNGEQDLQQKKDYAKEAAVIGYNILHNEAKSNTFKQFLEIKKHLNSRYNIFDKMSSSNLNYGNRFWNRKYHY